MNAPADVPLGSSRVLRRRIANDLTEMRGRHGWSQAHVASLVGGGTSRLANVETQRNLPRLDYLEALLHAYGQQAKVPEYRAMLEQARTKDPQWRHVDLTADPLGYDDFVGLEQGASDIEGYEMRLVPGILQTRAYAQHVLQGRQRSTTGVERKVDIRLRRQELLTRDDAPAQLWMVIEERVLDRPIGSPEVMREQCAHLLALAELDNVQIQVCPESVGSHAGLTSSFVILRFASPRDPGLVSVEAHVKTLFFEQQREIDQYAKIMDHLRTIALSQEESVTLIDTKRREVGEHGLS